MAKIPAKTAPKVDSRVAVAEYRRALQAALDCIDIWPSTLPSRWRKLHQELECTGRAAGLAVLGDPDRWES